MSREKVAGGLDGWLAKGRRESEMGLAEGRPGRRKRLYQSMEQQYGGVRIPSDVRKAAEGVLEGLVLKIWWVTDNPWMWPSQDDTKYYDLNGAQRVTPKMLWEVGQHDDVIDVLLAMKGEFYPALRRAGLE